MSELAGVSMAIFKRTLPQRRRFRYLVDSRGVYRNETIKDAAEYEMPTYDAVVCSDCLEHMTTEQAQKFLNNLNCKKAYIVVPFEMEQEAVDGNPHEEHKQDDLTPVAMKLRYPELTMIKTNETKGLYLWQK